MAPLVLPHGCSDGCCLKPDNAVVESFFQLLKRERIKRRIYGSREQAKADVFDYIEMYYNPVRHHGNNNGLFPVKFERQYFERQAGV